MKELARRLRLRPAVTAQILGATLFVNLLSFASPLFVMLILGQYVQSGFDTTLVTLSLGMCIALLMQVAFRQLRTLMAATLSEGPDREIASAVFEGLARSRTMALGRVPHARRRELPGLLATVQGAHAPVTVCAVADAPFSLLFVLAAFWFSPLLGWIGIGFCVAALTAGVLSIGASRTAARDAERGMAAARGLAAMVGEGAETVRTFRAGAYTRALWDRELGRVFSLRRLMAVVRVRTRETQQALAVLARVVVYAVGAWLCVRGEMTFVGLIVANILISRTIRQLTQFVSARDQLLRAETALDDLRDFLRIPLEPSAGTALRRYSGRLELSDVAFAFPGSTGPLFESLDLELAPGSLTVVSGRNGSGKTTLARLLAGVIDPMRGEVLAEGITLRQMAPDWWRTKVAYFPQEPELLAGTLRENVLLPRLDDEEQPDFDELARRAGLARYVASLPEGADTPVAEGGRALPMGVRRRVALTRALAVEARVALFDEPFEGLDEDGAAAVGSAIRDYLAAGTTVVVFASDPAPFTGAHVHVNLNAKPVPEVRVLGKPAPAAGRGEEDGHGRQA